MRAPTYHASVLRERRGMSPTTTDRNDVVQVGWDAAGSITVVAPTHHSPVLRDCGAVIVPTSYSGDNPNI
jgi:hypothetical protein